MKHKRYNPEKSVWRGRSYKRGGKRIGEVRHADAARHKLIESSSANS